MKVATINFTGNVGKTTVATNIFKARMKDGLSIEVESLNETEGDSEVVRAEKFGQIQSELLVLDDAIIDVGASNIEEFMKLMRQYRGSHEDFDLFVVPVVKDSKLNDTIGTIEALSVMGVPAKKIRVVFNRVEHTDDVEHVFAPIFAYHEDGKKFTLSKKAVIYYSELYAVMKAYGTNIAELMQNDQAHYKEKLKEALASKDEDSIERAKQFVGMRRLAESAQENLNTVYSALVK